VNLTGIILTGGKGSRFDFNKLKIKAGSVPLFIDQIFKLSFFCDEIIVSTSSNNYSVVSSELGKIGTYQKKYDLKKLKVPGIKRYLKIDPENLCKKISIFPDIKTNIRIILDENNAVGSKKFSRSYPAGGPVVGIYTSLAGAVCFYSIVVAFDMPFISYRLLKSLVYNFVPDTKEKGGSISISGNHSGAKAARIIKTGKGFEVLCGLYSKDCLGVLKENIKKQKYKISDIFNYLDTEIIPGYRLRSSKIDDLNFFNINRTQDYYKFRSLWQNKNKSFNTSTSFIETWADFFFR